MTGKKVCEWICWPFKAIRYEQGLDVYITGDGYGATPQEAALALRRIAKWLADEVPLV